MAYFFCDTAKIAFALNIITSLTFNFSITKVSFSERLISLISQTGSSTFLPINSSTKLSLLEQQYIVTNLHLQTK